MSSKTGRIVLPSKEEVRLWGESQNGRDVYKTMSDIDWAHHGDAPKAWEIQRDDYKNEAAMVRHAKRLVGQFPIEDIYNAAFVGDENKMLVSERDEWLSPRGSLEDILRPYFSHEYVEKHGGTHTIIGIIATVRSNRWRIFDPLQAYHLRNSKDMKACVPGIQQQGYVFLWRDPKNCLYVPFTFR